jgi:hypothetical protein
LVLPVDGAKCIFVARLASAQEVAVGVSTCPSHPVFGTL